MEQRSVNSRGKKKWSGGVAFGTRKEAASGSLNLRPTAAQKEINTLYKSISVLQIHVEVKLDAAWVVCRSLSKAASRSSTSSSPTLAARGGPADALGETGLAIGR
jgi:hypothetical protein